jgi:hypothetical protein
MDIQVDPATYSEFRDRILRNLTLSTTTQRVLEEFAGVDVTSDVLAHIIQRNQYLEHLLVSQVQGLGLKDTVPSLKAGVVLVGMQGVRDFLCAMQIIRKIQGKHPMIGEDGKADFKAADYVKYALKTEEYVQVRKVPFADTAYAAGYLFDMLRYIGMEVFKAPKTFEDYVQEVYKQGLKSARLAVEIYKEVKLASFSKYVFGAALIHDVGKLAMDLLYAGAGKETYANFRAMVAKRDYGREVRHYWEQKTFGFSHEYYGSQIASTFPVFGSVEKPILFHHEPFLVKNQNRDTWKLSQVLCLASNMANNFRIPKDTNDPIYKQWLNSELLDFKVDRKFLIMLMSKVGNDRF